MSFDELQFNNSTVQVTTGQFNVRVFAPSDFVRRKTAPWVYLSPEVISEPAFPPEYIGLTIRADDITTLCGESVTLNVEYTLDPADYTGQVDLFWEQLTGQTVTIDDPTLKNPTITYNPNENADFIMRVYIDKGKSQEIFADANIIRTPLGVSVLGNTNSSVNTGTIINRSGVQVLTKVDTCVIGNQNAISSGNYLNIGEVPHVRGKSLNVSSLTQLPQVVDQNGTILPLYDYNDMQFTQINWGIPIGSYFSNYDFYAVELYENGILIETYFTKIRSYNAPLNGNDYSVALLYINRFSGKIGRTHQELYINSSAFASGAASYAPTKLIQDLSVVGNRNISSITDKTIVRSGVQVLNQTDVSVIGNLNLVKLISATITRINGISIGT